MRVCIVGFEGVSDLDREGPLEIFAKARAQDDQAKGQPLYEVIIPALEGKSFVLEAGVVFRATRAVENDPTSSKFSTDRKVGILTAPPQGNDSFIEKRT